jgi:WD40 repeat protein
MKRKPFSRRSLVTAWSAQMLCAALSAGTLLSGLQAAEEAKPAGPKITYDEHVRSVLREHCFTCHNQNEKKSGLALDSYTAAMAGGSSGEVIYAADLDSSRVWALVNHDDQPHMPPNQDKLAAAKLNIIKAWIEGGALENAGSKAVTKKKTTVALSTTSGSGRPENPAMPGSLWKQPVVYTARSGAITALAASPWAPVVAVASHRQVVLYHSDTGQFLGILPFPDGTPYVLRFSRDGAVLLAAGGRGGATGCAVLYDVKTGRRLAKVGDELDAVLAADINDTHTRVALGGPQRLVRIYATETGEQVAQIKKHTDWITAIEYSPDGVLLATGDRANGLFVWEADTAREYQDLRGHKDAVSDVSWRPDSNILASASLDGSIILWEMNEGKNIKSWNAHGGGAMSVRFTHDGRLATTGRDRIAKIWDGNGKLLKDFPALPEIGLKVAFTHDGKRLLAGDWSGQVRLWEAADAKEVAQLSLFPPTLAMRLEAAQARVNAAQATAQKVQAELAAAQQAVNDKTAAAQAAAQQATADAAVAQKVEGERVAATTAAQQAPADAKPAAQKQLDAKTVEAKAAADKAAASKAQADKLAVEKAEAEKQLAAKKTPADAAQQELNAAKASLDQAAAEKAAFEQAKAKLTAAVEEAKKQSEAAAEQATAALQAFVEAYGP